MEIESIPFSYLSIQEVDQFGNTISNRLARDFAEDEWIQALITELAGPLDATRDAIGSSQKKEGTAEIQAADQLLDRTFIGFKNFVFSYEYSPVEELKAAAELLIPIFEQNDTQLYNRGYDEQAAKLESLIADLKKPKAKAALETLNGADWLSLLEAQLKTLEGLRHQRTGTNATLETPTDKAAKNALIDTIKNVLSDINTLNRHNKVPGLVEADRFFEARMKDILVNARARKTRQNKKDGADVTTE